MNAEKLEFWNNNKSQDLKYHSVLATQIHMNNEKHSLKFKKKT